MKLNNIDTLLFMYAIICDIVTVLFAIVTNDEERLPLLSHKPSQKRTYSVFDQLSPRDSTRYVSAALRLRSGFAPPSSDPHRLCFESTTVQYGQTTDVVRPRSSRDNHIITCDRSYRSVL